MGPEVNQQPASPAIVLNGRFLTRQATGVDRFATELLRAVHAAGMPAPVALVPASDGAVPPTAAMITAGPWAPREVGRRRGHAWEQIDLPRAAGEQPLINLCNTAPALRTQQMVVIHDAASAANPGNYTFAFRSWYRLLLGTLMRRSRVVATVSKFSADELQRHFGPRRPRQGGLEIIGEGGEHILREPADTGIVERLGLAGRRYVLAVGSRSPNKNFAGVLEALQRLPHADLLLVATGPTNISAGAIFGKTQALADPRVVSAGYVSDAELRALYENAACFAFPSFYEGFGLPPLEAMCCGCPVVVSRRASLPEVCGDAALYCEPDEPATLARALARVLDSRGLREDLAAAGRTRAAAWTWAAAGRQFGQIVQARLA
ncbi:MAG: glycosyltransferase family 4 protein [Burkholderiales bacterium]|nr:glycosyltransferase family 4 protein [Burkholderiales bacterium]